MSAKPRVDFLTRQRYWYYGATPEAPAGLEPTVRNALTDLFTTGIYRDRILDSGGVLHFRQRIVVCDSNHFDTLLAIPL